MNNDQFEKILRSGQNAPDFEAMIIYNDKKIFKDLQINKMQ